MWVVAMTQRFPWVVTCVVRFSEQYCERKVVVRKCGSLVCNVSFRMNIELKFPRQWMQDWCMKLLKRMMWFHEGGSMEARRRGPCRRKKQMVGSLIWANICSLCWIYEDE
ncbi:hypothetical protein SESBI_42221 [Sesbania bispinosa]|nr:hypothetical protein SESBI_42221 [Sesbania bispinosa]